MKSMKEDKVQEVAPHPLLQVVRAMGVLVPAQIKTRAKFMEMAKLPACSEAAEVEGSS